MAKRIGAAKAAKSVTLPKTNLWTFFGGFWKKLSAEKQEQDEINAIEHLTREQLQSKQKVQLRLKR